MICRKNCVSSLGSRVPVRVCLWRINDCVCRAADAGASAVPWPEGILLLWDVWCSLFGWRGHSHHLGAVWSYEVRPLRQDKLRLHGLFHWRAESSWPAVFRETQLLRGGRGADVWRCSTLQQGAQMLPRSRLPLHQEYVYIRPLWCISTDPRKTSSASSRYTLTVILYTFTPLLIRAD